MTSIRESITRRFAPPQPLSHGLYHYQSPPDNPLNYRLHLRIEPSGNGVLIINASTVLHLNTTATEYAYHIVSDTPEEEVSQIVAKRYRVGRKQALQDFTNLQEQIISLVTTIDLDPVTYFGFERHKPFTDEISAPYRLDCALTYQLPNKSDQRSVPTKRVNRELDTSEWITILEKAWAAGIPHVLFTGGEPTLREDLIEIVQHAERAGLVTGLLSDGVKLSDTSYLDKLLQAGLDHAMVILSPDDNQSWDSLAGFSYWADVLKEDIFVAAHLTITPENQDQSHKLLDKLAVAGVSAVSLSANKPALHEQLLEARTYADEIDLELIWDLPVPYSKINPVALELELEEDEIATEGAGKGWMYVEPDGDVLRQQGGKTRVGNMLTDAWEEIWAASKNR